jgi:sec-independent protein translocase protein TatA
MGGMSMMHWIVLIVIVMLLLGPSKIPEIGKSLGLAIRDLKKGLEDNNSDEIQSAQRSAKSADVEMVGAKKTEKEKV